MPKRTTQAVSASTSAPDQKRKPRKRAPGRPSADTAQLRPQLLDAALRCFARCGIAASTLRAIAKEAGVTPALLHYYFGDRAQLLQAVIAERFMPALAAMRAPLSQANDPSAMVAAFVRAMMRTVRENPWLPPLWVREVLCEGGALRDLLVEQVGPQLPRMLAERFAQAQNAGRLPQGLDPALLVSSLVGLTLFPAAGAPVWQRLFGAPELDADAIERHALALLGHVFANADDEEAKS